MALKTLVVSLALVGCGSEAAREPAREPAPAPSEQPSEPEPVEPCEPVECEAEVGSSAFSHFTSPDCRPESRVAVIKPGDPIAYATMCELDAHGQAAHVWVTAGQVTSAGLWGGADCQDLSHIMADVDLWAVVELEQCPTI